MRCQVLGSLALIKHWKLKGNLKECSQDYKDKKCFKFLALEVKKIPELGLLRSDCKFEAVVQCFVMSWEYH